MDLQDIKIELLCAENADRVRRIRREDISEAFVDPEVSASGVNFGAPDFFQQIRQGITIGYALPYFLHYKPCFCRRRDPLAHRISSSLSRKASSPKVFTFQNMAWLPPAVMAESLILSPH